MEQSASTEIYERVAAIVARRLNIAPDAIGRDTRIVDELGAESLDVISILGQIEAEFEVEVPAERLAHLQTVHDITEALVEQRIHGSDAMKQGGVQA